MNIHAGIHLDGNEEIEVENNMCEEDKHEYITITFAHGTTIFGSEEIMKVLHEELSKALYDEFTYEQLEDIVSSLKVEIERLKEDKYYLEQLIEEKGRLG